MNGGNGTEKHILEVAGQMFLERGYDGTSMSDIAAEMGMNRPALHYYFRTKDKLFIAAFVETINGFLPNVQSILESDAGFIEKLDRILDQYIAVLRKNPTLPRFIFNESQRDLKGLIALINGVGYDKYMRSLRDNLMRAMDSGELRRMPPEVVFSAFFGLLVFPFFGSHVLSYMFDLDGKKYDAFISDWKLRVIDQMRALLVP